MAMTVWLNWLHLPPVHGAVRLRYSNLVALERPYLVTSSQSTLGHLREYLVRTLVKTARGTLLLASDGPLSLALSVVQCIPASPVGVPESLE